MIQNEEIIRLFKLYLEGRTNSQQEEILFSYLAEHKNKDHEFHELMEEAWHNEPLQPYSPTATTKELDQIWTKLGQKKQKKIQHYQLFKYAASILIILSATFGLYRYLKQTPAEERIEMLSKITKKGEKLKMILPDSSVVYLGSGSKLTWPAHFVKGSHRKISLEGEAFFEVKRDTTSPFIVYTGKMQTQVLGTSFNIYAYPSDQNFSVAVRTGKVKVSENAKGNIRRLSLLTPGMRLVYHGNNSAYTVNTTRIAEVDGWITNRFVFRNENLMSILKQLERYYNVRFELKRNKLADCRFNATFMNKNIKEVMEQLRIMSGNHMHYKINTTDQLITLWGEGCQ